MEQASFTHVIGKEPKTLTPDTAVSMWGKLLSSGKFKPGLISVNAATDSALCIAFNISRVQEGMLDDNVAKVAVTLQHIYFDMFDLTDKQKEAFTVTRYQEGLYVYMTVPDWELSLIKKRKVLQELHQNMDAIHVPGIHNNARYFDLVRLYVPNLSVQVYTSLDVRLHKCVLQPLFPSTSTSSFSTDSNPLDKFAEEKEDDSETEEEETMSGASSTHREEKKLPIPPDGYNYNFCTKLDPSLCSFEVKLRKNNTAYTRLKIKIDNINDVSNVGFESEMEMVSSLVKMLAKHRCMEYNSFIEVGQCIFNACYGREIGIGLWQIAAEKSEHLPLCTSKWDDFDMVDDRSINLLRMWAKMDNKETFLKWRNSNINEFIRESVKVTGGRADIANVFYTLNQDKYVCSNYSNNEWYEFITRWRFVDGAYSIKKAITDELVPKYVEALNEFNRHMTLAESDVERDRWNKYVDRCTKIIRDLKDDGFKNSILKSCAERFYDENFDKERDKIPYLLGFDDGVFDCNMGKFRPADPREKVTITCGYQIPQFYHWEHPHVLRVLQIMSMIITNPVVREFYFATMGDLLRSGNRMKRMLVSIGPSNSGKSVLENISEYSLGDEYWVKPPVDQLTYQGDSNPDGATASREILRYAKEVNYSEPKANAKLNDSFLKSGASGGDGMFSRNLHQKVARGSTMKIRPGYLPIYNTNYAPKYDGTDTSLLNRFIFLHNNSQFIDVINNISGITVPETFDEQMKTKTFPMDIHLKDEIKDKKLYQAWMWIRCQYNSKYMDKYIEVPPEIKEYSRLISKKNDPIMEFLNLRVSKGDSPDDSIEAENLYASFVAYHKSRYPSDPKNGPSSADLFEEKMIYKGYILKDNRWQGIKWRK